MIYTATIRRSVGRHHTATHYATTGTVTIAVDGFDPRRDLDGNDMTTIRDAVEHPLPGGMVVAGIERKDGES